MQIPRIPLFDPLEESQFIALDLIYSINNILTKIRTI